jgi:hypothetical protein
VPFLLFVLCLGAVAILSGYFLGKYLMSSLSSLKVPSSPQGTAGSDVERPAAVTTLNAPGMNLYRVQAGLFNVKENADRMASSLQKAGIPALIAGEGPYRVIVCLVPGSDAANKIAQTVKAKGFEALVGKYELKGTSFKVRGDSEYAGLVREAVEASAGAIQKSLGAVGSYIVGGQADPKDIVEAAARVSDLKSRLGAAKVPEGGEKVHKAVGDMLQSASDALQSLSVAASSGRPAPSVLSDVSRAVISYEKVVSGLPTD